MLYQFGLPGEVRGSLFGLDIIRCMHVDTLRSGAVGCHNDTSPALNAVIRAAGE